MRKIIETSKAPAPIGAYSQAIQVDSQLFISGQIGLDPISGEFVSDTDVSLQFKQIIRNLTAICEQADCSLYDIAKLNIFLLDMNVFPVINQIMEEAFQDAKNYPARAVVQVSALPKAALVEADAYAILSSN